MSKLRNSALLVCLILALPGIGAAGQNPAQGGTAGSTGAQGGSTAAGGRAGAQSASAGQITPPPQTGDPSFQGSVPQGKASATPIPLTLGEAIDRGLKANLGLLTSEQSSREIRAQRLRALATLLPQLTGQVNATEQQINLQAVGFLFSIPGLQIPHIVGPYSYQDAQVNAQITLFDYTAISNYKASGEETKAAVLSIKNARDLVVQGVGNAYLQIIADAARITATQAEIDADSAVYTNAVRRHDAGTAIGIDVLRSQVELKQRQQQLVAVTNQFEKDKLTLGRVIGLAIGQDFTVADPEASVPLSAVSLQDALSKAYDHRPDYQAAKARVLAAQFSLRGAKAERYPTVTANGFYGDEGLNLFNNSHGVFNVTGSLQFNIFDGGRIKADILQNDAELKNRRSELENLRGQIDFEVRSALLDLNSARAQVEVAQSNVQLANQNVTQSRDRFAAGVTNTLEVVQAQQSLADANENLISAQYQYNVAKVSLARSLGLAEENIRTYFAKEP
ncbi:MAG: TolC family protein [Acidobacteriota bacterium]|nr:TolC family protein [Acidobacteriota bacterium]